MSRGGAAPAREIVLVRHAHAAPHEPGLEDYERRLDARGRREAHAMAALAAEAGLLPDHLLTSPADRARETAHEFAKAFGFPLPRIRHDDRAYLAERPQLVAILRGAPDAARRVLLVGHNPGLSELAEWLTGEDVGNLPTASVYVAAGALERWSDLSHGAFGRTRYDWPR